MPMLNAEDNQGKSVNMGLSFARLPKALVYRVISLFINSLELSGKGKTGNRAYREPITL